MFTTPVPFCVCVCVILLWIAMHLMKVSVECLYDTAGRKQLHQTSWTSLNELFLTRPLLAPVSRWQPELNYCELVVLLSNRHHCVFIITHLCHPSGYIPRQTSDPCLCINNDFSCNWTCNCATPQSYLNNSGCSDSGMLYCWVMLLKWHFCNVSQK